MIFSQEFVTKQETNKQTKQTFSHFTPIFSGELDVTIPHQIYTAEVPGRTVWTQWRRWRIWSPMSPGSLPATPTGSPTGLVNPSQGTKFYMKCSRIISRITKIIRRVRNTLQTEYFYILHIYIYLYAVYNIYTYICIWLFIMIFKNHGWSQLRSISYSSDHLLLLFPE